MMGTGESSWLKAGTMTAGLGGFVAMTSFGFTRGLLERFVLPKPGVCLARNDLSSAGGVLTPAAAMGDALLGRLRENAGLKFEIVD
jgi:hypothetical protein